MSAIEKEPRPVILLVEDSKIFSKLINRRITTILNFETKVAATLKEAIEHIDNNEFSLAVLDLNLPDAPNGEVVDYVAAKKIPAIVFTGTYDDHERTRILDKSVCDYIIKESPNAIDNVLRSIERIIKNKSTKILVVDDSSTSRAVIRKMLERYCFKVVETAKSTEAADILRSNPDIKLVITDYNMPEMDGFELVTKIRETYPSDMLAIIGISSHGEAALSAKFLKKGANDFITKPFFHEEFYNRIVLNIETIEYFEKMKDKNMRLSELNQLKNKFLGIAAHDLRNPLGSIKGFSEVLLSGAVGTVPAEQKEFLKIINDASNGMLTLLNDLLDVSTIESGKLDLNIKPDSVRKLLEDRLQINKMVAQNKNIALNATLADIPNGLFDYDRMVQVIDNLLSNAIKFSPQDSNVYITLSRESETAVISVRDEGPGFAEEDIGKLFGEFQKLSARPTAGEKSTGLGLSIVKKIVEGHKGTITASNASGKGAIFSFTIPLKN